MVPAITPWTGRGAIGQWRRRMSIGADLAAARQQAGMSTAQVSEQTCIRKPIIDAIERDDFSICGADFYARGHIRAIAHAVGVDAEPLVREYDANRGISPARAAAGTPGPSAPGDPGQRWKRAGAIAALIVLVAALGGVIYHAEALRHTGHAAAAGREPHSAHHAAHKHTAPAAAHHAPRHVVISVTAVSEPCWAELTTRHGAVIFEGIIGPGTSRTWKERRAVTLRLGNPAAVTLRVDGRRRTGLGPNSVTLSLAPGRRASG